MELTTMHTAILRRIEAGLLVDPTTVVQELTAMGYVMRNRYVYSAHEVGWKYDLTPSGRAVLNPQPIARGNRKGLATWMD